MEHLLTKDILKIDLYMNYFLDRTKNLASLVLPGRVKEVTFSSP